MPTEKIRFPGASGGLLAARLELPPRPRAFALVAHCFTCSKDLRPLRELSAALAERGIATLRFDFTGLGESEGDFADTSFSSNLEDLVAAADYLREHHSAPAILAGHSLGGTACLAVASRIPEVVSVVTLGSPSDPSHLQTTALAGADRDAEISEVTIAGRSFTVRRQMIRDLEQHRVLDAVSKLGRALLVLHSPVDQVVDPRHALEIYEAAEHPKSQVSIDGADHLLVGRGEGAWVGDLIASWAERYLPEEDDPSLAQGLVEVKGGSAGFAQSVLLGRHRLAADEPTSLGGTDTGPDPYGLLLAALGACTSMTVRMYANRKGWQVDDIRVLLRHHKVHAKDCEDCETESGKIDVIEKHLELTGDLDDEQRQRLVEIAERCPVNRTLLSEIKIRWHSDLEVGA